MVTSCSNNSVLPLKKRIMTLNDATNNALVATKTEKNLSSAKKEYKGVVQHQNGRWGAQIYADQKRIWLGTFSSAEEAAMAYDTASIKLRGSDDNSYRNLPPSDLTVHEPEFQKGYTIEAVLNLLKDGSYQRELRDFVRDRSQIVVGSKQSRRDEESKQIFQKKLTASDVGKLNRLVIPKKYAVKYLPFINDQSEREEGELVEGVEAVFYDRAMRLWKFRYCYWRSSQSFVFTSGWNAFVKEKNLKEKDVIVFYTSDFPSLKGQRDKSLMIDVHYFSDNDPVVTNQKVQKTVHNCFEEVKKTQNFCSSEENKGGFKLFGAWIQ